MTCSECHQEYHSSCAKKLAKLGHNTLAKEGQSLDKNGKKGLGNNFICGICA